MRHGDEHTGGIVAKVSGLVFDLAETRMDFELASGWVELAVDRLGCELAEGRLGCGLDIVSFL
jgi:hypothetical protein